MSDKIDLTQGENFVAELEHLLQWISEIVAAGNVVELDPRQKSQIAGIFMLISNQLVHFVAKLKEWGYVL